MHPNDSRKIVAFDTSALNCLHDLADGKDVIRALKREGCTPLASALNVEEVYSTPDPKRRASLLAFAGLMSEEFVLRHPTVLLADLADGVEGKIPITDSVSLDPVHAESRQAEFRKSQRWVQKSFNTTFTEFREDYADLPPIEPPTFAAWLQVVGSEEMRLKLAKRLVESLLNREGKVEIGVLLENSPEWETLTMAYAYSHFRRCILPEGYSAKRNANFVDLHYSAYLPHCWMFVTCDCAQLQALRVANVWNEWKCNVGTVQQFRRVVLESGNSGAYRACPKPADKRPDCCRLGTPGHRSAG